MVKESIFSVKRQQLQALYTISSSKFVFDHLPPCPPQTQRGSEEKCSWDATCAGAGKNTKRQESSSIPREKYPRKLLIKLWFFWTDRSSFQPKWMVDKKVLCQLLANNFPTIYYVQRDLWKNKKNYDTLPLISQLISNLTWFGDSNWSIWSYQSNWSITFKPVKPVGSID